MPGSTHLLVANPTAQSGKNAARIARVVDLLRQKGVIADVLPTLPAGGTIGAVREALRDGGLRVVIAMGGDGTFREVAAGLLESGRAEEVALAMMPTGTANDQGRSFGLSSAESALERNVDVIVAGHETRLDAGRITARTDDGDEAARTWFFDSAGWGISARVLAERNKDRALVETLPVVREFWRDKLVYAGAFVRVFLDSYVVSDKFDAVVIADGVRHELGGLTDLIVKATRIYAGAWIFDRDARHDDGIFEIVPFAGKRDWTSKAMLDFEGNPLREEALNAIGIRHSTQISAAKIELTMSPKPGARPLAAQLDGEELVATPHVTIEVVPRALRLVVPE
jgi:diacylglycerol kinase family enzyme